MDIKTQMKILSFINKCTQNRTTPIYSNQYIPQKIDFSQFKEDVHLKRISPQKATIPSQYLLSFLKEFNELKHTNPHGVMIIKDEKVILDVSYSPYHNHIMHVTHSLCKSITSLAVLFAIQEKLIHLDDLVIDYFSKETTMLTAFKLKKLTIKHLLTMSSGVDFTEPNSLVENNWVKGYLEANLKFKPGTKFHYNSLNTYILSVIITKVTHQTLEEYLTKRLFEPLGIFQHYFESCPKGYNKGGWGVYLSLESMAKIGLLYLNKGVYNHQRLIDEKLIEEATSFQINTDPTLYLYGYGYHIWLNEKENCYQFNGMLGQNVVIIPEKNMVVAMCAGSTSVFANSPEIELINRYFVFPTLKFKPYLDLSYFKLKKQLKSTRFNPFSTSLPLQLLQPYHRRLINLKPNIASIMPLFIQGLNNNYTLGIESIMLEVEKKKLKLVIKESHHEYEIDTSLKQQVLEFNQEYYKISTSYQLTYNEDQQLVLKLEICFIETSNVRVIKIFFKDNECQLIFDEIPKLKELMNNQDSSLMMGHHKFFNIKDQGYFEYYIDRWLNPHVKGEIEKDENKGGF